MYISEINQYEHLAKIVVLTEDEETQLNRLLNKDHSNFLNKDGEIVNPFSTIYCFPNHNEYLVLDSKAIKICNNLVLKGKLLKIKNCIFKFTE